jgi:hypothetical protein
MHAAPGSSEQSLTWDLRARADDGTRTRDPHLGKVMLYQLSHVRVWDDFSKVPGSASHRRHQRSVHVSRDEPHTTASSSRTLRSAMSAAALPATQPASSMFLTLEVLTCPNSCSTARSTACCRPASTGK